MTFRKLAEYFSQLEQTSSRLSMTEILSHLFRDVKSSEIDKVLYLLQGRIAPLYEKKEFLLGERMLIRALSKALNMEQKQFISEYKKAGDLGKTIEILRKKVKIDEKKDLSIEGVFELLSKITDTGGAGSQEGKMAIIAELVQNLDPLSTRFVVRIPTNTLRLGFSDMTMLDAFSWMMNGDKSLRPEIEKAYHVRPDLGFIGKTLKEKGIVGLKHVKPALFTPIIMMKAERLSSAEDIIDKVGKGIVEPKYDGFRLQVHYRKKDHRVKLYSRGLEDVTFMYPDIERGVIREVMADEIIFEGEAIGFDPATNSFLPFQETVQRKRKYDIVAKAKEIPLKLFAFELLYADDINYLTIPFEKRRKQLDKFIKLSGNKIEDTLLLSPEEIGDSVKKIELIFDDAVSKGLEGIMVKKLNGIYQPGARGWNWIKFKRSYSSKIEDTIDCLIMGYDFGKGKRTGFGIGAFLVGVLDTKKDLFVTVAKIGTGLTDEEWRELKKRTLKEKSNKQHARYEVDRIMDVDAWVKPSIVVEIRADEITRSPTHTAGRILKKTSTGNAYEVDIPGFALRFPRLERFRDDKRPNDVTTLKEVEKMYKKQKK